MPSRQLTSSSAELVLDAKAELAEGPVWDGLRQVLWWVDINAGRLHRFDPKSGSDGSVDFGSPVGCVVVAEDGRLVVAAANHLVAYHPEKDARETLVRFEPERPSGAAARGTDPVRCNDGKCDPQGRFWIGRMAFDRSPGVGSMVRFDGLAVETILRGMAIPNGLDWSCDGRRMYLVDSRDRAISVLDFDAATGAVGPRRVFIRAESIPGLPPSSVPDGLTIDTEDCLWVAMWGGGCVLRLAPDGTLLGRIDVPVSRVSSCAFGGEDLGDLYITTAWEDATPDERTAQPTAGGLYRARPGVRGRAAWPMRQERTA